MPRPNRSSNLFIAALLAISLAGLMMACGDDDNDDDDNVTPSPNGACCAAGGSCSETTQAACTGTWKGAGTLCSTANICTPPDPTGACCAVDGTCTVTTQAACTGSWKGAATTCSAGTCPDVRLTATWRGSATLVDNCPLPYCRWNGPADPPAATLVLTHSGTQVSGRVDISISTLDAVPLQPNAVCSTISRTGNISNGTMVGNDLTFRDPWGNAWELRLTGNALTGRIVGGLPLCSGWDSSDVRLTKQ